MGRLRPGAHCRLGAEAGVRAPRPSARAAWSWPVFPSVGEAVGSPPSPQEDLQAADTSRAGSPLPRPLQPAAPAPVTPVTSALRLFLKSLGLRRYSFTGHISLVIKGPVPGREVYLLPETLNPAPRGGKDRALRGPHTCQGLTACLQACSFGVATQESSWVDSRWRDARSVRRRRSGELMRDLGDCSHLLGLFQGADESLAQLRRA